MIECKDQRRARGTVFFRGKDANGHDQFTETNYAGDVFYDNWDARGDGETGWRRVDITLEPAQSGWSVQFAPYTAVIPATAAQHLQFCDKRNDAGKRKNMAWSIEAVGVSNVQGVQAGREVVYQDAFGAGAHLVYQAQRHGIAKLVRIDPSSTVQGPFIFRAHLPTGWKVVRQGGGTDYELLPTGKKELNTRKRTAFVGNGEETYASPFMWRSGPDSGILAVTAENVGGNTWEITKEIPQEWTRESALEMDVTATSTLSSDGYVVHAGVTSYQNCVGGVGTSIDTTATVLQNYHRGDGGTNNCQRPFMIFTNSVPAGATITNVKIKARPATVVKLRSGNDNHTIVLTRFLPANYAAPAASDYVYTGGMPSDSGGPSNVISTASASAYIEWSTSGATFLNNITNGGYSAWSLRNYTITSVNNTDLYPLINGGSYYSGTAGYVYFESANAGGSYPPVEEIDYTLPTGGIPSGLMIMGVG